jgi:hypothetical protein
VSGVAWRSLADVRSEPAPPAMVGDVVRTGENFYPHYRVIAVADDRAWVRDVQCGTDHVVAINRCVRIDPSDRRPGSANPVIRSSSV